MKKCVDMSYKVFKPQWISSKMIHIVLFNQELNQVLNLIYFIFKHKIQMQYRSQI